MPGSSKNTADCCGVRGSHDKAAGHRRQRLCRQATELLRRGHFVRAGVRGAGGLAEGVEPGVVGDIGSAADWTAALRGTDVVIHLVARVHVMRDTEADPLAAFRRVNVEGTANLARQAAHAGVRRLVYVSSIGVNGLLTGADRAFSETDRLAPHNAYALSKWEDEQSL